MKLGPFRDQAALSGLFLMVSAAIFGCGTEAVGVDACRTIEKARCEQASSCGVSDGDVASCKEFYEDQCLHGLQNARNPDDREVDLCVAALNTVSSCAGQGVKAISECQSIELTKDADSTLSPCTVLLEQVELLEACSFIATPPISSNGSGGAQGGESSTGGTSAGGGEPQGGDATGGAS